MDNKNKENAYQLKLDKIVNKKNVLEESLDNYMKILEKRSIDSETKDRIYYCLTLIELYHQILLKVLNLKKKFEKALKLGINYDKYLLEIIEQIKRMEALLKKNKNNYKNDKIDSFSIKDLICEKTIKIRVEKYLMKIFKLNLNSITKIKKIKDFLTKKINDLKKDTKIDKKEINKIESCLKDDEKIDKNNFRKNYLLNNKYYNNNSKNRFKTLSPKISYYDSHESVFPRIQSGSTSKSKNKVKKKKRLKNSESKFYLNSIYKKSSKIFNYIFYRFK